MNNGFDFNNDGKVDELEEFLTYDLSRRAAKNNGCLTATLIMLIIPLILIVSLI